MFWYHEETARAPAFLAPQSPQEGVMFLGWYDPDPGAPPVKIRARDFIARWTFYIGEDAGEPAEQPAHRAAA